MVRVKSLIFSIYLEFRVGEEMTSIFENKKLLLIVVAWFIVSYLVLWFIGGACLNPMNGANCLAPDTLQGLSKVPLVGLLFPYNQWNSLMYFFAPIVGFVLAFIMIKWWNNNFDTSEASGIGFLVLILLLLFVGYYINLYYYVGEAASLNSRNGVSYSLYFCITESDSSVCSQTVQRINSELQTQAQSKGEQTVSQFFPVDYWGELRKSMYLLFILGAIAAWLPFFAKGLYEKYNTKE